MKRVVDLFAEPTYLLTDDGEVVHANPAARAIHPEPPSWMSGVPGESAEGIESEKIRACRVQVDDGFCWIVVLGVDGKERVRRAQAAIHALSPRYREVVALLLEGLTDKEIAARLDLAPSSARAYAARIYKKLGVRGRVELLATTSTRSVEPE